MSNNRNEKNRRLAGVFRALSNPNRLRILQLLVKYCPAGRACCTKEEMSLCVRDLGKMLGIAASTVSHHMKELRVSGLIRMEKRGQFNEMRIEAGTLEALAAFFRGLAQAKKEPVPRGVEPSAGGGMA